ncbi:hypothetical protein C9374_008122 [Naegleria lovaniensis]|uniref:Uncharacterized protein n=1 Tax=Naegleria lovaniensis TaxID=51637 RepID=A0AA88GH77_NAELO|nr:uncharacterized protein C9374_008122 [Naegleria lovaniensis]KAG2378483.1 hypothetical protein C9374_008122 [Naegleria lovaniensis]
MGQAYSNLPPEFEQALRKVLHFNSETLQQTCPSWEQQVEVIRDMILPLYDHAQFKHFIQTKIDALVLKHLGFILSYLINNVYNGVINSSESEHHHHQLTVQQSMLVLEIEKIIICIYELASYMLSNPFLYQSLALNLLQSEKDKPQEKELVYNYYIEPAFYFIANSKILETVLKFLKELISGGGSRAMFLSPSTGSNPEEDKISERKKQDFLGSILEIQQHFSLKSRGFELFYTILEFYLHGEKPKKSKKLALKTHSCHVILITLDILKTILDQENSQVSKYFCSTFGLQKDTTLNDRKKFCQTILLLCQVYPLTPIHQEEHEVDLFFLIRMNAIHLLFILLNESSVIGRQNILECIIIFGALLHQLRGLLLSPQQASDHSAKQTLISMEFLRVCCNVDCGKTYINPCEILVHNLLPSQLVKQLVNQQKQQDASTHEANILLRDSSSYDLIWNQQMRDELLKVLDSEILLTEDRLASISNDLQWTSALNMSKDLKIRYKTISNEIEVNGIYIERAIEYVSSHPEDTVENLLTFDTFEGLYEKMFLLSNIDKEDVEMKNRILGCLFKLNEIIRLGQHIPLTPSDKTDNELTILNSKNATMHRMNYLSLLLSVKHFKDEYFYNTTLLISSILSNKKKIHSYMEDLDKEDTLHNLMLHMAREQLVAYHVQTSSTTYADVEAVRRILSLLYILGELLNHRPRRMVDIVNNPHYVNVLVMNLNIRSNRPEKLELIWQTVFLIHTLVESPLYNSSSLRQNLHKTGIFEIMLTIITTMEEHSTKCLATIAKFLKSFHMIPVSEACTEYYSYLRYFLPSQLLKLLNSDKDKDVDTFISAVSKKDHNSPFLFWNSSHRALLCETLKNRFKTFDEKRLGLSSQIIETQQMDPLRLPKLIFSTSPSTSYLYGYEEPTVLKYVDLEEKLSVHDIFVEGFVNSVPSNDVETDTPIHEIVDPEIFLSKLIEALEQEQNRNNANLIVQAQTKLYYQFSLGKFTPSQSSSIHFLKYQGYSSLFRKYTSMLSETQDISEIIHALNIVVHLLASQLEPEPEISHRNKLLFITSGGLNFVSVNILKEPACRNNEQLMINCLRVLDAIADVLMPVALEDEERKLVPTSFFDDFVPLLEPPYMHKYPEISLRTIHCIRKYAKHQQIDLETANAPPVSNSPSELLKDNSRLIQNRFKLMLQLVHLGLLYQLPENAMSESNSDSISFMKTICLACIEIIHHLLSSQLSSVFERSLEKILGKNIVTCLLQINSNNNRRSPSNLILLFPGVQTFDDFYQFIRTDHSDYLLVWNKEIRGDLQSLIQACNNNDNEMVNQWIQSFSPNTLKLEGILPLLNPPIDIYTERLYRAFKDSNISSLSEFFEHMNETIVNSTTFVQSLVSSLHALLVEEYKQKSVMKDRLRPLSIQIRLLHLVICSEDSTDPTAETQEQQLIFLNESYQQIVVHLYHLLVGYLDTLSEQEAYILDALDQIYQILSRISKFYTKFYTKIGSQKTRDFYKLLLGCLHKYLVYALYAKQTLPRQEVLLLNIMDSMAHFFKTQLDANERSTFCVNNGLFATVLYGSVVGGKFDKMAVRKKATQLISLFVKLSIESIHPLLKQALFPLSHTFLQQGDVEGFITYFDEDHVNPEVIWNAKSRELLSTYLDEHLKQVFNHFFVTKRLEDYSFDVQSFTNTFILESEYGYKIGPVYLNKYNETPSYNFTTITNQQFLELIIERLSTLCAKFEETKVNNTDERKTIWRTAFNFIQNQSLYSDKSLENTTSQIPSNVEQQLLLLLELFCREIIYITQSEEKQDLFVINLLCFLSSFVKKYSHTFCQFLNNFSDFSTILLNVGNQYRNILRSVLQILLDLTSMLISSTSTTTTTTQDPSTAATLTASTTTTPTQISTPLFESLMDQLGSELNLAYILVFIVNKIQPAQCAEFLLNFSKVDTHLTQFLTETYGIPQTFFNSTPEGLVESIHSVNNNEGSEWTEEQFQNLCTKCQQMVSEFEQQQVV